MSTDRSPHPHRTGRWMLFFLAWLSAAYFTPQEAGWNVNTRLALTYAMVDEHRLTIDSFHERPGYDTGDKAFIDEHFYSDKLIGNSLVAVVPFQIARWLGVSTGPAGKRWICTAFTVSLSFALLLIVMAGLMERQGVTPRTATWLSALGGFGTMLYPYAGLMMPYVPGCLFAMLAYRLTLTDDPDDEPWKIPMWRIALAGVCLGVAMLFDLLFGLVGLFIGLHVIGSQLIQFALDNEGEKCDRGIFKVLLCAVLPIVGLAPFMLYSWKIFGGLTIPYEFEHDEFFREAMATGFAGIHFPPDWRILVLVTFHTFRGMFVYSPLLLMGVVGWFALPRLPHGKKRALMFAGVALGYLIVNGGYTHQWWGGWACGPRLMIPALPFYLLGVAAAWGRWKWARPVILTLGTVSVLYHVAALAIDPQIPTLMPSQISSQVNANEYLMRAELGMWYPNPLWVWRMRGWLSGQESLTLLSPLGMGAPWSWLLLIGVWAGGVFALVVWKKKD